MSNGAAEEAVYGDTERRAAAASCWKAALQNHPLLLHQVNISTSNTKTRRQDKTSPAHVFYLQPVLSYRS